MIALHRRQRTVVTGVLDAVYLFALLAGTLWTWPWVVAGFWVVGTAAALRQLQQDPACAWLLPLCALLPLTAFDQVTRATIDAVATSAAQIRGQRLGLAALLLLIIAGSATNTIGTRVVDPLLEPLDEQATSYLQRTFVRAGASFAMARGIDRAVAVVGNAEVRPIGFAIQPGQLFKPVQDMAVRFADLMVVVMALVGTQLVVSEIAAVVTIPVLVTGAASLLLLSLAVPVRWTPLLFRLAGGVVMVSLLLRLLIPVVALAVSLLAGSVLNERRDAIEAEIGVPVDEEVAADPADTDSFTAFLGRLREELGTSVATVASFADDLVGQLVDLTVIYVVEVILAPLLILAILYYLYRRARAVPRGGGH